MTPEEIYEARWVWANANLKEIAQHHDETWEVWKRLHALNATRMIEIGSYAGGSLYAPLRVSVFGLRSFDTFLSIHP